MTEQNELLNISHPSHSPFWQVENRQKGRSIERRLKDRIQGRQIILFCGSGSASVLVIYRPFLKVLYKVVQTSLRTQKFLCPCTHTYSPTHYHQILRLLHKIPFKTNISILKKSLAFIYLVRKIIVKESRTAYFQWVEQQKIKMMFLRILWLNNKFLINI